uniref:CKLF-like MARVEL transmembrane domain containing 8b n=1 Tax=Myripristis murdjan TaxID=586833 RepID=A0A668AVA8_9TELE
NERHGLKSKPSKSYLRAASPSLPDLIQPHNFDLNVCGLLVWILVGGTDYFRVSALCWVMFVTVLCWFLTICLFIIYLTGVHNRIPQVPWTTVALCFNSSATVLYLVTASVEAFFVSQAIRGRHNYNSWAASTFFAFLSTLCYAGSSCLSYWAWRAAEEKH